MATYEMPLPISTNNIFFNLPQGGRGKTARYKKWLHDAGMMLVCQRAKPVMGQVEINIVVSEKSRCDPDNAIKALLDAIVSRGLIEDDSPRFVRRLTLERSDKIEGSLITIRPAMQAVLA